MTVRRLAVAAAIVTLWRWWRSDGQPPFPVAAAILWWHARRGQRRRAWA